MEEKDHACDDCGGEEAYGVGGWMEVEEALVQVSSDVASSHATAVE